MLIAILLRLALQDAAPPAPETWTELRTGAPFDLVLLGRHALRFDDEEGGSTRWGAVGIDPAGRALVQAETGGAVHVFDAEGRELLVCRPPTPTRGDWICFVAADARGRVVAERGPLGPADLYDERGAWMETGAPPGVEPGDLFRALIAPDGAGGWWVARSGPLHVRGGETLQALPRRPDGSRWRCIWVVGRGASGPLVVDFPCNTVGLDGLSQLDPDPSSYLIVYDAECELERSLALPEELERYICATPELVVFLGAGSSWDALDVLDLESGVVRRANSRIELRPRDAWGVVEREGRVELWHLHERSRALLRFALPFGRAR